MVVTFTFDTEKDEDINLHKTYIKSEDMSMAIWDIAQMFRERLKYGSNDGYEEIQKLSDKFYEIIDDYDLKFILK